MKDYDGFTVGEYQSVEAVIITVAGATFVEKVSDFPTVELYVKIAFAVNTGNLARRKWWETLITGL